MLIWNLIPLQDVFENLFAKRLYCKKQLDTLCSFLLNKTFYLFTWVRAKINLPLESLIIIFFFKSSLSSFAEH